MVGPDILIEGLGFRVLEAGCYSYGVGEGLGFVYFEARFRFWKVWGCFRFQGLLWRSWESGIFPYSGQGSNPKP